MNQTAFLTPDAYDAQVRDIGLVNHDRDPALDTLTAMAARILAVPTTAVSVVQRGQDRQFFKSAIGLPELVRDLRQTPMSHSFCQYVQSADAPLVVRNAHSDARVAGNPAIRDLDVVAYLGAPLHLPDGTPIGAFCAIDTVPRDWTNADLQTIQQMAQAVDEIIALRQDLAQAEAQRARAETEAEARKTFLAHMSHEIRTPLNGIIGSVDLLLRAATSLASDPREQTDLLRTVNRSAQNLQRLLNDALDIAKIDAGKLELVVQPFDLRAVVEDVSKLFAATAARKGVSLCQEFTDLPPGERRLGDSFRLSQVLCNLLSNAVKFTEEGSVCISLRGTALGVQIEVRDSGCGIPSDRIEALFQPFTQAEATTAHTKGGTGLGMSITKQMVELMGGRIRASSTPGKGTSFFVSLPLQPAAISYGAQDLEEALATYEGEELPQLLKGCRVLVADDSPANRLVLQKMLEQLGAVVDKAFDGGDAFGRAVTTAYDVLLLDIQMPGYDGTEVVKKLRRHARHQAREALCIAVTGNAMNEQVAQYLDAGFDAWIAKPLRQSDLLRVLSPLLHDSGSEGEAS